MKLESTTIVTEIRDEDDDADDSLLREVLNMAARPAPAMLAVGQVIDDAYRIEELIGEGGMGRVYRARDIRLERDVAIKVHVVVAVNGQQWSLREAAALAQLSHPNVVTVFEVGTWSEHPWVAMEYVRGGTVRTWLAEKARTPREIIAMFTAAGRGLAAAHTAGIVHRDFKPDNVLVTADGQPRVADFGLALELAKSGEHPNLVMGTPAYMAPEQWTKGAVGPAADQFAFAVALWEALAGVRPYRGTTEAELVAAFRSPPPVPKRPMLRHVEAALRRALARDPLQRWPTLAPLLDELARDPQRTRRRFFGAAAAAVVLIGSGVAVASWRNASTEAEVEAPCAHATDALAATTALRAKLPAVTGDRTLPKVDGWMTSWQAARTTACEDTYVRRTQSVALLQLRELCFERARAKVESALQEMISGVDRARFADGLPQLAECDDKTLERIAPLPTDPAARATIEQISAGLARVEVLRLAAKLPEAGQALAPLLPKAEATGRKELVAEVWLMRGAMNIALNVLDGNVEMFEKAAKLAAEAGDDKLVARAWMSVLDLLVARQELPNEAIKMAAVAEAAVLRAGNTPRLRAELAGVLGDIDIKRGDWKAAAAHYEEAIALHTQVFGETVELARQLNRLASIAIEVDDAASARRHLRRAGDILEQLHGPRFRHLAVIWTTLGNLELRTAHWQAAREQLDRAVALKEESGGKDSPTLVPTLTSRTWALSELGELDAAEQDARRALEIARKAFGPEHAKVVETSIAMGQLQNARANWKAAAAAFTEGQRIQRKIGNVPPLDQLELELAKLAIRDKRFADARASVERARPIAATQGETSYWAGKVHEISGRIAHAEGRRDEARGHWERALAIIEARRGPEHPETVALRTALSSDPAAAMP
jgi:tetratricopeptide (TPR) repeat protein